jgi:predicted DNA-binding protein (MmcQ/YjbR family)
MTIDQFNAFCKSLAHATHVVQWGGSHVWKVGDKLFAICSTPKEGGLGFTFKCSELSFHLLQEQQGCRVAPYFKARWIQCFHQKILDDKALKLYIAESYKLIVANLSKKKQSELNLHC